jgi:hypothetical protein
MGGRGILLPTLLGAVVDLDSQMRRGRQLDSQSDICALLIKVDSARVGGWRANEWQECY